MGKLSDILEKTTSDCLNTLDETDPICDEIIRASLSSHEKRKGKRKRNWVLILLGVGVLSVAAAGTVSWDYSWGSNWY